MATHKNLYSGVRRRGESCDPPSRFVVLSLAMHGKMKKYYYSYFALLIVLLSWWNCDYDLLVHVSGHTSATIYTIHSQQYGVNKH